MSKTNRLGMFADVREILDAALAHGGGSFECATHGDAVHWRQRAYQFRKHYAEVLGPKAMSPYDILVLPRLPADGKTVVITIRQTAGVFKPAGPAIAHIEGNDPLFEEALRLAGKLDAAGAED